MTEERKPWDRQRDEGGELEPNLWFHRFAEFYLKQGPDRTLLGAVNLWRAQKGLQRTSYVPGAWRNAYNKGRWKERAEQWDAEEKRKNDILWEERRQQVKDQDFDQAQTLRDKVAEFLKVMSSFKRRSETQTVAEDGTVTRVVTIALDASITQIASALKVASELQRLAAEMLPPTQKVELGSDPKRPVKVDLTSLSDAELEAIEGGGEG